MNRTTLGLLWVAVIFSLAAAAAGIAVLLRTPTGAAAGGEALEQRTQLASHLANEGLPQDALAEYDLALRLDSAPAKTKANMAYLAGNLAYDDLKDYTRALAYYERSLFYNATPETGVKRKMMERVAECQERMGKTLDASQTLSKSTYLAGQDTRTPKGAVVAKIGDRQITMGEIDEAIQRFPPETQKQFADPKAKRDFARNYVVQDLIVAKAKRMGLQNDPEVRRELDAAEKEVLAQTVFNREVAEKATVQPSEVELYYEQHKDMFVQPRRTRVAQMLLDSQEAVDEAEKQLAAGDEFTSATVSLSRDAATRAKGGELGWVFEREPLSVPGVKGDSAEAARAILALNVGEVSKPIKMEDGWHLFKALEKQEAQTVEFEKVKPMVESMLRRAHMQEMQQKIVEELMTAEKAQVFDDAFGANPPASAPAEGNEAKGNL
ncbi:MAG: peptidyl-prolyl cis-trans isomerase [Candidatus Sumerlaeota bacterium]|nr:peptidyl-prolyl cis-trans isomerase [Candidatus Sumerlaeota bacterium]